MGCLFYLGASCVWECHRELRSWAHGRGRQEAGSCFVCLPVKCLCDVLCRVVLVLCLVRRACQASPQLLPSTAIRSSPSRFVDDAHNYSVRATSSIRVTENQSWAFPASASSGRWLHWGPGTSCLSGRSDKLWERKNLLSIPGEGNEVQHVQRQPKAASYLWLDSHTFHALWSQPIK